MTAKFSVVLQQEQRMEMTTIRGNCERGRQFDEHVRLDDITRCEVNDLGTRNGLYSSQTGLRTASCV